jgi:hypothetical protein
MLMQRMIRIAFVMLALSGVRAGAADETAITIYSSASPGAMSPDLYRPVPGGSLQPAGSVPGYALVRQDRGFHIEAGRSQLRFTDVAALIDPTTVTFTSLTDPSTRVLEQNFQFDLVSADKLLQKYVDRPVAIERQGGATITGTLLSSADGLVVRAADGGISSVRDYAVLKFPELPGGLITRPTLLWDLSAAKAGEQRARVTYQTAGITWWADYNLIYSAGATANSGFLDLAAWVSIVNQSGAGFTDAKLKLVAGDVHRAPSATAPRAVMMLAAAARAKDEGFIEKAFDEFHLYTLGHPTTLPNNATKQLELFDAARRVPAQREFVYAASPEGYAGAGPLTDRALGAATAAKVDSVLVFRNDKASGLGLPLPAGRVRVSRLDVDGSLEFIGEDVIDHTPRDETLRVKLGSAFDIVGERHQVAFSIDTKARWMEEEIEVTLRNHKAEPVEVQVRESLFRGAGWTILSASQPYRKIDARAIVAAVKLAADGHAALRYKVRYTW